MEQLARDLGILLSGFMTPIRLMGIGLLFFVLSTGIAGRAVLAVQDVIDRRVVRVRTGWDSGDDHPAG